MSAEPRDFLDAEICLWCGNYSCTCEDAPDPIVSPTRRRVDASASANQGAAD